MLSESSSIARVTSVYINAAVRVPLVFVVPAILRAVGVISMDVCGRARVC